jgi:hypothetical protein
VLAVTGDYATGAIRSSVQWVPRRGILYATRLLVAVVVATAFAVTAAAAADLLAWALVGEAAEVVAGDIAASLGRIARVAPEGAERLFDRYERRRKDVAGAGLGLYLARRYARAHGGELRLLPADDDEGNTFEARLPARSSSTAA